MARFKRAHIEEYKDGRVIVFFADDYAPSLDKHECRQVFRLEEDEKNFSHLETMASKKQIKDFTARMVKPKRGLITEKWLEDPTYDFSEAKPNPYTKK